MARYIHRIKINGKIAYRCFISATDSYFLSTTPESIEPVIDTMDLCLERLVDDLFRAKELLGKEMPKPREAYFEFYKQLLKKWKLYDLDAFLDFVESRRIRDLMPRLTEDEVNLFHEATDYLRNECVMGSPQPSTVFDFPPLRQVVKQYLGRDYLDSPRNDDEEILFNALEYLHYIENTYIQGNVKACGAIMAN